MDSGCAITRLESLAVSFCKAHWIADSDTETGYDAAPSSNYRAKYMSRIQTEHRADNLPEDGEAGGTQKLTSKQTRSDVRNAKKLALKVQ